MQIQPHLTQTIRRVAGRARRETRRVDARFSRRVGVFCYHQVGSTSCDPWNLAVAPDRFEQHLEVMSETGRIVRLTDEMTQPRRSRLGTTSRRYALTFDDGYHDSLVTALPTLERHEAPVTVFIPTGFIDKPAFWWDRIAAFTLTEGRSITGTAEAAATVGIIGQSQIADATRWTPLQLHDELYHGVLRRSDIDGSLDELEAELPDPPRPSQRPMTTDELIKFASHPLVDIGGHTVHHPNLPLLGDAAVAVEIRCGLEHLRRILGDGVELFAYPHGECSRRTTRIVASERISHAFTTADRWVSPFDSHLRIPRLHPRDLDRVGFTRWLDGEKVSASGPVHEPAPPSS